MKKLLFVLAFIFLLSASGECALEDLTTFTEVDEDGDIVITPSKCDVNTIRRFEY